MMHTGRAPEAGDPRVHLEVLAWRTARHGHDDLAAHLFGVVVAAHDAVGTSRPLIDPGSTTRPTRWCGAGWAPHPMEPHGTRGTDSGAGALPVVGADDGEPAVVP